MPQRTSECRHVSHRVIYSPDTPEMPWHATRSKNSAYARAHGAHRLAHHPDSIALIAKCGEPLQQGFPILVFTGVNLAFLELRALLRPQLDRHRGGDAYPCCDTAASRASHLSATLFCGGFPAPLVRRPSLLRNPTQKEAVADAMNRHSRQIQQPNLYTRSANASTKRATALRGSRG